MMNDGVLNDQYRIGDDGLTRQAMASIGGIAWGTIGLLLGAWAAFGAVCAAVVMDALPILAGTLINGVLIYFIYTPMHEAVHGNFQGKVRSAKWLNDFFGTLNSVPLILPYHWHKYTHLAHHNSTNEEGLDPDHWMAVRGVAPIVFRSLTVVLGHMAFFLQKQAGRVTRKHLIYGWLEAAVTFAIMSALIASGLWLEVLLLWVVPQFLGFALVGFFFDWLVHVPHKETARFRDTSMFRFPEPLDTLICWLYLWQNYHLIHHLFPRLPFYRMRKVYRLMGDDLAERKSAIYRFGV